MTLLTFDQLIHAVHAAAPSDEPLEQLRTAAVVSASITESADALLGHFVDQSRRAGHSWTEIGVALGVTKQAAQKRFVGSLDRFTPRARDVAEKAAARVAAAGRDLSYGDL